MLWESVALQEQEAGPLWGPRKQTLMDDDSPWDADSWRNESDQLSGASVDALTNMMGKQWFPEGNRMLLPLEGLDTDVICTFLLEMIFEIEAQEIPQAP